MKQTKSFQIEKRVIVEAYKRVKANGGTYGVDKQSMKDFEENLKDNLYKIWNRMSSGTYFPPPVRRVEIPKANGKKRPLGIPTISDRIAQMVAKIYFEPECEKYFHPDSYGYRPKKSAIDAVGVARKRCWKYNWVIDLDIKGFFDAIDHQLLMKAVRKHTQCKWLVLYIERWLKAKVQLQNGKLEERNVGSPQGSVISPVLSNLMLHYAFDVWIERTIPGTVFERYADDIIVHCRTFQESKRILKQIEDRLKDCKLELNLEKTKIVYCKDSKRKENYSVVSFDFLGYQFCPRLSRSYKGDLFLNFVPAMSKKAKKRLFKVMRSWKIPQRMGSTLNDIAAVINRIVRGWITYYGAYRKTALSYLFFILNRKLIGWARNRFKKLKRSSKRAEKFIRNIARSNRSLFVHWEFLGSFKG